MWPAQSVSSFYAAKNSWSLVLLPSLVKPTRIAVQHVKQTAWDGDYLDLVAGNILDEV
jgi:hypothetical protein